MSTLKDITLPDIGTTEAVDVLEVHIKIGDVIAVETPLITLESDKATMDVPSSDAGVVMEVMIKVGDKVRENDVIARVEIQLNDIKNTISEKNNEPAVKPVAQPTQPVPLAVVAPIRVVSQADIHAGPAVRRVAREFGVDLSRVKATGPKNRILKEDIQAYVKAELAKTQQGSGVGLPDAPDVDFSKFGEIEKQSLSRIKKLSGKYLHRNWLLIPHITQFEEADITEMEAYRKIEKEKAENAGFKLTPLAFIMKAVAKTLAAFPTFNASLDKSGDFLILKKYFHIGVAVDTPEGLVVPVIREVDQKTVFELAKELNTMSEKAREGKLQAKEIQGGCFTISSLGGIGGTAFTPIINMPEVAILGVSRAAIKPIYQNNAFAPRLMLPLSLSYDHRVIDGAEGARFIVYLKKLLESVTELQT